jgi:hypothetical protein
MHVNNASSLRPNPVSLLPAAQLRRRSAKAVKRNWTGPLAVAERERREQERRRTPFRLATLHIDGGKEPCVLENISAGGLQAWVYRKLGSGLNVLVELSDGEWIPAMIAWCRDWTVGVEFFSAIDVDAVLCSPPADIDAKDVRLPRLEVSCPARLQIGLRAYAVRLCDISEGGAKVKLRTPMKKLSSATLTLPDLPPVLGYIRWVDGLTLGLGFDDPLPHEVLARWAESRHLSGIPVSFG